MTKMPQSPISPPDRILKENWALNILRPKTKSNEDVKRENRDKKLDSLLVKKKKWWQIF